jgi:hypothetical protein
MRFAAASGRFASRERPAYHGYDVDSTAVEDDTRQLEG